MTHDELILALCRELFRGQDFGLAMEAEDYVTDPVIKEQIREITVRLYHRDEGYDI